MPVPRHGPSLEVLEDRTVCTAAFPDPTHLTLSFVPDGTNAGTGPSDLFAALAPTGSSVAWETAILRAFQSWAAVANINIAVTADDGSPLGTVGQAEGDPRFGDIRIAACPLGNTAVATGTPYLASGSTWSGDVVFNTNYAFGSGPGTYDLYTVALHEAGHVFGLDDNTDPTSALYGGYIGPRAGPGAGDVAAIQALYGARPAGPVATLNAVAGGPASVLQAADALSGGQDVRTYAFGVDGGSHPAGVDVTLKTAGLSLLTGRLSVFDAAGNLVGTAAAPDPLDGDLMVHLSQVQPNQQFTVRVTAAQNDVFATGAYQLTVNLNPGQPPSGAQAIAAARDAGSYTGATPLTLRGSFAAGPLDAVYSFQTQSNVDYSAGVDLALEAWGVAVQPPTLTVYDAAGNVLATASAAASANGHVGLHLTGVTAGTRYYVRATAAASPRIGLGNYVLEIGGDPGPGMPLLAAVPFSANPFASVTLQPLATFPSQSRYEVVGTLANGLDFDLYRIKSPPLAAGQAGTVTVTVLAQQPRGLQPVVKVLDGNHLPVTATVLNNGGVYTVQFVPALANADYYLAVTPLLGSGGNYYLTASGNAGPAVAPQSLGAGALTAAAQQEYSVLTVNQDQLVGVSLAVTGAAGQGVRLVISDAAGIVVFDQTAAAGQPPLAGTVYLNAGTYSVTYIAVPPAGQAPAVGFALAGETLSDPLGALQTPTGFVQPTLLVTNPVSRPPATYTPPRFN